MAIVNIASSKAAESGFYPTPPHLIRKMLDKVQWYMVDTILEPSAGKGDLALAAIEEMNIRRRFPPERVDMDCVEIDEHLRAILKDKGLRVVHDDFLTYNTMKQYSLILMNPPFEDGDDHLMKAMSLLKPEGQLVCLLNAETIRNPYSQRRKELVRALDLAGADIEYIPDAFAHAERVAGVDVAMITYKAPASKEEKGILTEKLKPAHKYVDMTESEEMALTKADFIDAIVDRYNYEVECGCLLIREYGAMKKILNNSISSDHGYQNPLSLLVEKESASVNEYVRAVRRKYWSALFCSHQFMSQLTVNLRSSLTKQVDKMADYEFSVFNIYEIMLQVSGMVNDGVESTIMKLFDDWTFKYHWDDHSSNRHYFNGWKTNDAFAVNKKVIVPMYIWDSIFGKFDFWKLRDWLEDVEKTMNYLDGGRTVDGPTIREALEEAEKSRISKNIDTKYFSVTMYKKGTIHLEFKNMDLLAKFNIFAARGKNWLPPTFGKKKYAEMDKEEQAVVKSFMGDSRKYDAVVAHADYFLDNGTKPLALGA